MHEISPSQLAARDLFPDASDVYRVKRNLLDHLRRDPILQHVRENGRDEHLMEQEDMTVELDCIDSCLWEV